MRFKIGNIYQVVSIFNNIIYFILLVLVCIEISGLQCLELSVSCQICREFIKVYHLREIQQTRPGNCDHKYLSSDLRLHISAGFIPTSLTSSFRISRTT